MHYDRTGNSLGTAEVIFTTTCVPHHPQLALLGLCLIFSSNQLIANHFPLGSAAATQAQSEYNNVLLDGKPMHIELVADSNALTKAAAPVPLMIRASPCVARCRAFGPRVFFSG